MNARAAHANLFGGKQSLCSKGIEERREKSSSYFFVALLHFLGDEKSRNARVSNEPSKLGPVPVHFGTRVKSVQNWKENGLEDFPTIVSCLEFEIVHTLVHV